MPGSEWATDKQREHHPRQLTAGRRLAQRGQRARPRWARSPSRSRPAPRGPHPPSRSRSAISKRASPIASSASRSRTSLASFGAALARARVSLSASSSRCRQRLLELGVRPAFPDRTIGAGQLVAPGPAALGVGQHIGDRPAVLALAGVRAARAAPRSPPAAPGRPRPRRRPRRGRRGARPRGRPPRTAAPTSRSPPAGPAPRRAGRGLQLAGRRGDQARRRPRRSRQPAPRRRTTPPRISSPWWRSRSRSDRRAAPARPRWASAPRSRRARSSAGRARAHARRRARAATSLAGLERAHAPWASRSRPRSSRTAGLAAVGVQQLELGGGQRQAAVLVLAVERQQPAAELLQVGLGGRARPHTYARVRPSGHTRRASTSSVASAGIRSVARQLGRKVEDALDVGLGGAGAHDAHAAPDRRAADRGRGRAGSCRRPSRR